MFKNQSIKSSDLLLRFRRHEPGAMADLYDLHGRLLYSLTYRMVRNPEATEDLVQESFLRAWNWADQLVGEDSGLGPWLVEIARHCALGHLGRHAPPVAKFSAASKPHLEQTARIEEAFSGLSQKQKEVLELTFYDGLTQAEIASHLKQPLGCVWGRMRSALSWLGTGASVR